jgi:ribosomal protein L9
MNEFIELVNAMRKAQKRYKLFGTIEAKEHCNMLECEVDFQLSKHIEEDKIF